MKIQFLTLFLIVSLTGSAWARLGETEDQLIARYGDVIGKEHLDANGGERVAVDRLEFKKSGFNINVDLFNGVSAKEQISNAQGDSMSDQEIKTLLDANAQDHTWKEVPAGPQGTILWPEDDGTVDSRPGKMWQRDDGSVATTAFQGFMIKSKDLIDAEQAAYKAAHVHSLEGF